MKTSLLAVLILSSFSSQNSFAMTESVFSGQGDSFPLPCEIKCAGEEVKIDVMPSVLTLRDNPTVYRSEHYLVSSPNLPSEIKLGSSAYVDLRRNSIILVNNNESDLPEELRNMLKGGGELYGWAHAGIYNRQSCEVIAYSLNGNKILTQSMVRYYDGGIKFEMKKLKIIDQDNRSLNYDVATSYSYPLATAKSNAKARLAELRKIGLCSLERQ